MQRPRNFDCLCCSLTCSKVENSVTNSLNRFSLMAARSHKDGGRKACSRIGGRRCFRPYPCGGREWASRPYPCGGRHIPSEPYRFRGSNAGRKRGCTIQLRRTRTASVSWVGGCPAAGAKTNPDTLYMSTANTPAVLAGEAGELMMGDDGAGAIGHEHLGP